MNKNVWVCNENAFPLIYCVHWTTERNKNDLSLHEQWEMSSAAVNLSEEAMGYEHVLQFVLI